MDNLLIAVKDKLNITWTEKETERKIERLVLSAQKTLNYKLGAEIDYTIAGQEQTLFLNYCMYEWNDCANEFDENYLGEIMQIRQKYEVLEYEKEEFQ